MEPVTGLFLFPLFWLIGTLLKTPLFPAKVSRPIQLLSVWPAFRALICQYVYFPLLWIFSYCHTFLHYTCPSREIPESDRTNWKSESICPATNSFCCTSSMASTCGGLNPVPIWANYKLYFSNCATWRDVERTYDWRNFFASV
jgi:hypothetical protein